MLNKRSGSLTMNYAFLQIFYGFNYCCVFNFASVFLLSRGFSNSQVGITMAFANGASIILQPLISSFADKTRRVSLRLILAAFIIGSACCSLILWLVPNLQLITAIFYILLTCCMATQTALLTSVAMEHINSGKALNFSLARGFGSMAFAFMALALGFIVDDAGTWIIPPLNLGIAVIYTISTLRFPRPNQTTGVHSNTAKAFSFWQFARKYKRFMMVVLSVVVFFFPHVLINTFTIQIIRNVGGDSSEMGVASAIAAFLELPAMALFPLLMKKFKNTGMILKFSALFFVLKSIFTLTAQSIGMIYVAQCLQFFAFAIYVPASVYYTNQVIPGVDKVKGQACMGMAVIVSGVLGNTIGGILLDLYDVPFMLTIGTIVGIIGIIMLFCFMPRPDSHDNIIEGSVNLK